jgi:hypothetical protein
MNGAPLLDWLEKNEAEKRRDSGMESVARNNSAWLESCLNHLRYIAKHGEPDWDSLDNGFTGETIRKIMERKGLRPTKPQAWGSVCQQAARERIIVATGHYVQMQDPKSNARRTAQYQFVRD